MVEASHRIRVLFADPEGDWHRQAVALLEPRGVEAIGVRTGREALDRLEHEQVHVAVLDAQMPQLGGLQVVKMLRTREKAPPAILLAREVSSSLMHEALQMRVFSVLTKPVDLTLLLNTLARVVDRHYAGRWPGQS